MIPTLRAFHDMSLLTYCVPLSSGYAAHCMLKEKSRTIFQANSILFVKWQHQILPIKMNFIFNSLSINPIAALLFTE